MTEERNINGNQVNSWKEAKDRSDKKCKKLKKKIKRIKRKLKDADYMYSDDKKKIKRKLKKYRKMYNVEKAYCGYLLGDLDEADNRIRALEKEKENLSEKFELESRIQTLEIENNVQKVTMNFLVNELAPGLVAKYGAVADSNDVYPFE